MYRMYRMCDGLIFTAVVTLQMEILQSKQSQRDALSGTKLFIHNLLQH